MLGSIPDTLYFRGGATGWTNYTRGSPNEQVRKTTMVTTRVDAYQLGWDRGGTGNRRHRRRRNAYPDAVAKERRLDGDFARAWPRQQSSRPVVAGSPVRTTITSLPMRRCPGSWARSDLRNTAASSASTIRRVATSWRPHRARCYSIGVSIVGEEMAEAPGDRTQPGRLPAPRNGFEGRGSHQTPFASIKISGVGCWNIVAVGFVGS